jgi:hypothetical protein
MRSTLLCLLVVSACASAPGKRPPNIPATRHQIDDTIAADPGLTRVTPDFEYESAMPGAKPTHQPSAAGLTQARKIDSMGRVTDDRAVVYTRVGPARLEETWRREPDGWKLHHVKELGSNPGAAAAR